jgi:hypothetical protein
MNQLDSGPAALLYSVMATLIQINNELQQIYQQMAVAQVNVQSTTISAAQESTIGAAKDQAWGLGMQALNSAVGAISSLVQSVGDVAGTKELQDQAQTAQKELDSLNTFSNRIKSPQYPAEFGDNVAEGAENMTDNAKELAAGNFKNIALTTGKQEDIESMPPKDYLSFKQQLQSNIETLTKSVNTSWTQIQQKQQSIQQIASLVQNGVNTGLTGAQATFTGSQGQKQAAAQVTQSVTQMAGTTADTSRGQIGQFFSKVADLIAATKQAVQSSYAQT